MNKWLFTLLAQIVGQVTPQILADLREAVEAMVQKAEKTPNPFDNIFTGMLQMIVGKPGDKAEIKNDFR
jgi:hypothetical protein